MLNPKSEKKIEQEDFKSCVTEESSENSRGIQISADSPETDRMTQCCNLVELIIPHLLAVFKKIITPKKENQTDDGIEMIHQCECKYNTS